VVHSLSYTRLPGYFIAFDLYDKYTETFATRQELHALLRPTGIPVVPIICKKVFATKEELLPLLETRSRFRDGTVEGVYLRYEGADGLHRRCKLVRPDFVSGIGLHWSSQLQRKNVVCPDMALEYNGYTEVGESPRAEDVAEAHEIENARKIFDPQSRVTVDLNDGRSVRMMRNFSFLLPNQLAVASTPKHKEQVAALRHLGVSLVITLTEEEPLDASWFGDGIENLFVPVPNYEPPTVEQMDMIAKRVLQTIAEGGIVLEHCGGGKGRAGTVAACLLLRFGTAAIHCPYVNQGTVMSSQQAIEYVRSRRPGSLETVQQEHFVQQYAQHVWKLLAEADNGEQCSLEQQNSLKERVENCAVSCARKPKESPVKEARMAKELAKQQKNLMKRAPQIVMLVGIPGSGKSTFAASLETVSNGWKRISQDERGRRVCEELAGTWSKTGRVVLDRCNVEESDRKHWLRLMHNPKHCAAVYFDISVTKCLERVRERSGHPTIRGDTPGSEKIVQRFHDRLQVPTKQEGFENVYVVQSFEDSRKLLRSWGADE
jgi:protein-tyrosine phosphatase/predicted kinase